jgi:hypothetical protein
MSTKLERLQNAIQAARFCYDLSPNSERFLQYLEANVLPLYADTPDDEEIDEFIQEVLQMMATEEGEDVGEEAVEEPTEVQYFTEVTDATTLKRRYRELAIANHPDHGGDVATMQIINRQYESLKRRYC